MQRAHPEPPLKCSAHSLGCGEAAIECHRLQREVGRFQQVSGVVDSHVFQVPNAPTLDVDVDRSLASQFGLAQRSTASDVLITTNSSAQSAPNFWVDPRNNVSYPLVVQLPLRLPAASMATIPMVS